MESTSNSSIKKLRRIPLAIADSEYARVEFLMKSDTPLLPEDKKLILQVVENAKFWKERYVALNRSLWELTEQEQPRM